MRSSVGPDLMPDTDAILTWLWLPSLFTAAWLAAGADLMTGAKA